MKNLLCVLIFLFILASNAYSQDANNELLKKLVEKGVLTQSEANEINKENEKPKEDNSIMGSAKKIRDAFNTPYMKFGGYGLLTYNYKQYDNAHHDLAPRVVFLSMSGNLTDHLRYFALMDFVNPRLYEYYAEWMPHTAFNLRAGQFKVPFALENPLSLTELESIYNTRSISSLVGMSDDVLIRYTDAKNGAGRDIGVQASGSLFNIGTHDLLQYGVGVFQGAGINMTENNSTKDFAGTLYVQPVKNFRIAGGIYAGKAKYTRPDDDEEGDYGRNRWALSTDYKSDRFYARAEWIHGNDGGIKREGLYGTALWYFIPKKLNVVGKVDYYNQNKDLNSEVIDYLAGVNYYFWNQCRFQLNYIYSAYSRKWGGEHRSENAVQAQMQIVF